MLVINGSNGYSDSIVLGSAANNAVSLSFDGYDLGTIAPTNGSPFALVMAFGGSGYDTLDARKLTVSSVLVGGSDGDTLYGGSARNLLIGGLGADALYAGGAGDILIAGYTSYDANATALAYIMAEWNSSDSYSTRVSKIGKGGGLNGSYALSSSKVADDNAVDVLNGGAGLDWFFANKKGRRADQVNGLNSGETVTSI
jgi:Ca2+-binding RTX toxin-like protein